VAITIMNTAELIKEVGFDFDWDERKVWQLHEPVTTMHVSELDWHIDIPFWDKNGGTYNLSPRDVINHPELHPIEYERILKSDSSHPLDVMENKGRWLLLDGLHRLTKQVLGGKEQVRVRIIPRSRIPEILI
jgi:hypothetical protein